MAGMWTCYDVVDSSDVENDGQRCWRLEQRIEVDAGDNVRGRWYGCTEGVPGMRVGSAADCTDWRA